MKTRKRRRKNTVTKGLNPKKELNLKKTSKKTSKIKLKKMNCSPKPKGEMNNFSCYTNKSLFKLKSLWNSRHPDVKIKTNEPKEIHEELTRYLSSVCNKESCWLKQKGILSARDRELKDEFAPEMPKSWKKNPNEWLSSVDIMNVMKQYEKVYKCFDFIGPSPIDFDKKIVRGECVWEELCKFSVKEQLKKGKTKIGMIFNTDPHNRDGEHWISMFINIKTQTIFFFDSTGDKPKKEIMVLVERIIEEGKKMTPSIVFEFDSNEGVEHQYGNTECGIYSLFFIVHMLEDKFTKEYLKTHVLKDKYMEKFRHVYFNDAL
jgi:hypothetical protein